MKSESLGATVEWLDSQPKVVWNASVHSFGRWCSLVHLSLFVFTCVYCLCNCDYIIICIYLLRRSHHSQDWNQICKTSGLFRVFLNWPHSLLSLLTGWKAAILKSWRRCKLAQVALGILRHAVFRWHWPHWGHTGPCKTAIRAQVVLRVDAELLIHQKVWALKCFEYLWIKIRQWQRSLSLSTGEVELLGRAKFATVHSGSEKGQKQTIQWRIENKSTSLYIFRIPWELIGDT